MHAWFYVNRCVLPWFLAVSRYDVPPAVMRMNHYWGSRKQNWGEDTQEILDTTIKDSSGVYIVKQIECEEVGWGNC